MAAGAAPPIRRASGAAIVGLLVYFRFPSLAGLREFPSRPVLVVLALPHIAGAFWREY